ncbi:pilin, partial [Patescibacteria group bacterium]|nr:pilin [Patescibacteria group bacterium]
IAAVLFVAPMVAGAQTGNSGVPGGTGNSLVGFQNPLSANSICQALTLFLNAVSAIGGPIAVLFLVYAGFRMVWARGNTKELDAAKRNLWYTMLGIGIFMAAWVLGQVVANTLGALGAGTGNVNPTIGQCR